MNEFPNTFYIDDELREGVRERIPEFQETHYISMEW
jgi:hypothetical protein